MTEKEIWKSVGVFKGVDLTGYLEASNMGRIKRLARLDPRGNLLKEKIYGPRLNQYGNGFLVIRINNKNIFGTVAQYVMNAFRPDHPEGKNKICHIDGNKSNNRLDNLEWASQKEICHNAISIQKQSMALKMRVEPIVQLDMTNGNLVEEYRLREDIKINYPSNIATVINQKKYYSKGFIWLYKSDYENMTHKDIMNIIKEVNQRLNGRYEKHMKAVLQLDEQGNLIAEHRSITEAAKAIGCTKQAISLCLVDPQHHVTCKGYMWRFKMEE